MKQLGRAIHKVPPGVAVRGRRSKAGQHSAVVPTRGARRRSRAVKAIRFVSSGDSLPARTSSRASSGQVVGDPRKLSAGRRASTSAGRASKSVSPGLRLPARRPSRAKGACPAVSPDPTLPPRASSRRGLTGGVPRVTSAAAPLSKGTARASLSPNGMVPSPSPRGEEATKKGVSPDSLVSPLATVVSEIRQQHRQRQDYHSAEKRLTLQIKSLQRRKHAQTTGCVKAFHATCDGVYDIQTPTTRTLLRCQEPISAERELHEKEMKKAAQLLPVWPWAKSIKGFGALGLAQIVAECGDLNLGSPDRDGNQRPYTPSKLWKRMGVGRGYSDKPGPGGDETFYFGRSPVRRAILYCIGECLIRSGGPFKAIYDERKAYEATKPPCRRQFKTGGECFDPETGLCRKAHLHNRAKRYMEKRLLRDLWRAWRDA